MSLVAAALGKPVNGKIITPQAAFPNCRHLHSGLSGSEEDLLGINSWAEKARGLQSALLLSRVSSGVFMFESVEQGAVGTFHFLQLCSPVTLQTRGLGFPKACVPGCNSPQWTHTRFTPERGLSYEGFPASTPKHCSIFPTI